MYVAKLVAKVVARVVARVVAKFLHVYRIVIDCDTLA